MLVIVLAAFTGYLIGGFAYAAIFASIVLLIIALKFTIQEIYYTHRYKNEYEACSEAILSNDEFMVDQVNNWTTHFYVKKIFHASFEDTASVGYRYSIRSRRDDQGPDYGGGGVDGSVGFGVH